jgi:hypothetical protein
MALPIQKDIELPLLLEIETMGGEGRPQDIYPMITAHFPQITEADLVETISGGTNKWTNRIQWARQSLVLKKELERYPHGVWRITEKGRERLISRESMEGKPALVVEGPEVDGEKIVQPPKRHDELKLKMVEIGNKLGYTTSTEEGPEYRHDVLWRTTPYKTPSHVIEICEGGVLAKDFASLIWAKDKWEANGILVVTDDKDFEKSKRQLSGQSKITIVKAETIYTICELVMTDLEFLKLIFSR